MPTHNTRINSQGFLPFWVTCPPSVSHLSYELDLRLEADLSQNVTETSPGSRFDNDRLMDPVCGFRQILPKARGIPSRTKVSRVAWSAFNPFCSMMRGGMSVTTVTRSFSEVPGPDGAIDAKKSWIMFKSSLMAFKDWPNPSSNIWTFR